MANEEQSAILKSGIEEWNRWRKDKEVYINLHGADLVGADLRGADLRSVSLDYANLRRANLAEANLAHADLTGADLDEASLRDASLRNADLNGASIVNTDFHRADLRGAELCGTYLAFTNLREVDLRGADLSDAFIAGANLSARLSEVSGLEEIVHMGPSAISPAALESAQGRLPDVFLKGIGFKDWEILNAKLHDPNLRPDEITDIGYEIINLRTKGPIQVNTLFISYARVDSGFVEFLEKKLDDDGIRSWRDVHDMVAGPIEPQIERAIDLNGTVLLVLSKNSLGSDWVEWEVQKARGLQRKLEEEGKRDAHVLCPVAIDDAWKDSKWSGPLMNQLLKYNILDFSKWQDEEAVEKVYGKLKAGIAKYYSDFEDSV